MRQFFLIAVVFIQPLFYYSQIRAKVVGVKDGDTIDILEEGNVLKTLRLAEVDCPERGQPYGAKAKKFTSDKIFGKEIFYFPVQKDRYQRTVAKVYYGNGRYLSAEIIRAGYGWWFQRYSNDQNLGVLQQRAKISHKGLWKQVDPISPWEYRKIKRIRKTAGQQTARPPF